MIAHVVWLCIVYAASSYHGGPPSTVDNIANQANCEAVGRAMTSGSGSYVCMPVMKVFPK